MDEARCKELGRIITSEELYIIENVKSFNYSCDECGVELNPCSFLKDVNLIKPHFRIKKGFYHSLDCNADGDSKIRIKGNKTRLTSTEGFPLNYPNRFKMKNEDVSQPSGGNDSVGIATRQANKKNNESTDSNGRKSNYATSSFRSVVNQYFDFPWDRDRALFFDGVQGTRYDEVFKKIRSTKGKQEFMIQGGIQKVYYAALSWKLCKEENSLLKIELQSGRWVGLNNKRVKEKSYYLEIDFSDWPRQSKTKFLNEYKKITELVRGTDKKAAMAFVGKQDTRDDFFRFQSVDRRLISFKVFNDA